MHNSLVKLIVAYHLVKFCNKAGCVVQRIESAADPTYE